LRDALENKVAALVLKILVEYQVADFAGDPIKIDKKGGRPPKKEERAQ